MALPHAEQRTLGDWLYYDIEVALSGYRSFLYLSFHWGHLATPILPEETTMITMSLSFSPTSFLYWNTQPILNVDYTKPVLRNGPMDQ